MLSKQETRFWWVSLVGVKNPTRIARRSHFVLVLFLVKSWDSGCHSCLGQLVPTFRPFRWTIFWRTVGMDHTTYYHPNVPNTNMDDSIMITYGTLIPKNDFLKNWHKTTSRMGAIGFLSSTERRVKACDPVAPVAPALIHCEKQRPGARMWQHLRPETWRILGVLCQQFTEIQLSIYKDIDWLVVWNKFYFSIYWE